ncbi:MAG: TPM domain-containing protein, partial [Proteobacteria bacterium]|nr:TPM domain-containing protein [Pseudomonadota bacterium]
MTLLALFVVLAPGTAQAKVVDEAGLFSAATMSQLDQRISALKSTYDRDVLIVTVATLGGQTIPQVAQRYINVPVQRIGGVYIFIARQEKKIDIAIGANTMTAIPKDKKEQIRQGLVSAFRSGSFDTGILAAVSSIDDDLRLARSAGLPASAPDQVPVVRTAPAAPVESRASSGGGMGLFGWIFI